MAPNDSKKFYANNRSFYKLSYWGKISDIKQTGIYRPNGFNSLPAETYSYFCAQITHNGKVLDLGCGNGLMLLFLLEHSLHNLTPYGVDFLKPSIAQAKQILHSEFESNFIENNIVNYDYANAPFDFIFLDPYHIFSDDLPQLITTLLSVCNPGGRIIFYCYRDALAALGYSWVGEFSHLSELHLTRVDFHSVTFGIKDM